MGRPAKPLDRIKLYDHYTFDPTIPQLLRVKTPYGQSKRATGEPVSFYVHQNGYASVSVLGKRYRRSRVIYSLCKGHIPEGMFVDHIDGSPDLSQTSFLLCVFLNHGVDDSSVSLQLKASGPCIHWVVA